MDIYKLRESLSNEEAEKLYYLLRKDFEYEKHNIPIRFLYPKASKRLRNILFWLREYEGYNYVDEIKEHIFLSVRNSGQKTLMEFYNLIKDLDN